MFGGNWYTCYLISSCYALNPRPQTPFMQGDDYVISLSLGRRSVNLLPVVQRTNALTNGVVGRTMSRRS